MLKDQQDAYGHVLYDYLKGKDGHEITERDDGYFDIGPGPEFYFAEYENWSEQEKKAVTYVRGT